MSAKFKTIPEVTLKIHSTSRMSAKAMYTVLASMTPEERRGAVLALSLTTVMVEDGYVSLNEGELRSDFFTQCYDVVAGVALALKMLRDDGIVTEDVQNYAVELACVTRLPDATNALQHVESLLATRGSSSPI